MGCATSIRLLAMVGVDAASEDQHLTTSATAGAALSLGQFAHELDSLLEASFRCVGLVLRLALCRRIVAELGGRLRLSSAPPGPGMVMRVEVPVSRLFHR